MRKIAHLINPCVVPETSDLYVAQPVTFESLRRAQKFAETTVEVSLLSAQFPEDRAIVPADFVPTPDLNRSILDIGDFQSTRKLPLFQDLLKRLYEYSGDADFLVYTNVDIAVQREFYLEVDRLIDQGLDAFVITRRTISKTHTQPTEIELMYQEVGTPHPGHDCFVFSKDLFPKFILGNICIGAAWFDKSLLWNMIVHASHFAAFNDLCLTFHLGDDKRWKKTDSRELSLHNKQQVTDLLVSIETTHKPAYQNPKLWSHVHHVYEKLGFQAPKSNPLHLLLKGLTQKI
jgi:hypothetical protein